MFILCLYSTLQNYIKIPLSLIKQDFHSVEVHRASIYLILLTRPNLFTSLYTHDALNNKAMYPLILILNMFYPATCQHEIFSHSNTVIVSVNLKYLNIHF